MNSFPRIAKLSTAQSFRQHLRSLEPSLEFDDQLLSGSDSPLAEPVETGNGRIGNRFCILPMEGWDATPDGKPTDLTRRRWQRFGQSGAKLIWGGEAVAVRQDGRANPNQLLISDSTCSELESLRNALLVEHHDRFGNTDDVSVGLQLTHSGRFARPIDHGRLEARTVYRHPILDKKFDIDSRSAIMSDDQLERLIDDFLHAATLAAKAGFQWVDIKHCHGYLGHELLSGFDRPGKFGGSFENRTRFLRQIASGIRANQPELGIGVRISVFDFVPFIAAETGVGMPASMEHYRHAFGGDGSGTGIDLTEPAEFLKLLQALEINLVCTTAGSPYYNPHIQRPAAFPPSDGYLPPEDPLIGVARQIQVTAQLKKQFPDLIIVGSGYSYLQQWLPHVAQHNVRKQWVDSIGLGRMVLSYPELPADVIDGNPLQRKKICRTFSDCTTGPRNGLVSGCFPLDDFFKSHPHNQRLLAIKQAKKNASPS